MNAHHELSLVMANSMVIGTFEKEIRKLIDPDKAIMPQIWNMDHETYLKITNSPHWLFASSPRMFETDLMEPLSHNKWMRIFFVPIIYAAIYYQRVDWTGFNPTIILPFLILGIFAFTLLEYILHRFFFHSERYLPDSRAIRYAHCLLHGIHHMLPIDQDRLVYPPSLFLVTILLGYLTLGQIIYMGSDQATFIFWSGVVIGYFIYDLTHYALHHIDTSKSKGGYFHKLQQYHNQHHFGGE